MITIKEAEEILKKEYHVDNFLYVVDELLLPDFRADKHDVNFRNNIFTSVQQLGYSDKCDVNVYEVILNEGAQNRRVTITQEMFRILRGLGVNNAIVAFSNADRRNYRFSILTSKYEFDGEKVVKVLSNPRRYSYSLGYGTKTKTAYDFLIGKGKVNSLDELINRFSVEVVNKQFYNEIALAFTKLVGGQRDGKSFEKELNLYGVTDQNKYAEFAVRLIGRIVFCWFLKEKKSENGIPLIPESMLALDSVKTSRNYYHDTLEPLFFELLNTNQPRRKGKFAREEIYTQIPYLNGGLFSPHADDHYKFAPELQTGQYGLVTIPNGWFEHFYEILGQYNFTVDENTSYDIELSIDPEMLGRIFENLLAEINPETGENAKKSTGSFYTPRDIVDYMVDSSILEHLKAKTGIDEAKLRALISYGKEDDELATFSMLEKKALINALYTVTVLDPACGSGAFPIGMLQKIVYMLQEIDPEANLWFDKATENVSFLIKKEFEKKFNAGSLDYIRKLTVIQNSIFGVDIQPIAVEIARLRCFLSLVIEEKVYDDEPNRGINPLPNLDFKFIIANTLVTLPHDSDHNKDIQADQMSLFEREDHISQLKAVREEYFSTNDAESKNELKLAFSEIQKAMFQEALDNRKIASARYQALFQWAPFNNKPTDWFDPEWMFGVKDGFDIVIGNPPYVDSEQMTKTMPKERDYYAQHYQCAKGNWDLYIPFWEKSFSLLSNIGRVCLITPNKWLAIKYGSALRKHLFNYIYNISDYSSFYAFESADVSTVIVFAAKQSSEEICVNIFGDNYIQKSCKMVSKSAIKPFDNLSLCLSNSFDTLNKILNNPSLETKYDISGAATVSETYEIANIVEDMASPDENDYLLFINTETIDKFSSLWGKEVLTYVGKKYLYPVVKKDKLEALFPKRYNQSVIPKLITTGIRYFEVFGDFEGRYLAAKSTEIITSKNSSVRDIKILIPLLNSNVVFYFLKEAYGGIAMGGGITFSPDNLSKIPIPTLTSEQEALLIELADKYNGNFDEESQDVLDKAIYPIYRLSEIDISIIENFKKASKRKR